jgi:adenosylhomocysteinase
LYEYWKCTIDALTWPGE